MWMKVTVGTAGRRYLAGGYFTRALAVVMLLFPSAALAQAQKVAKGKSDKNAVAEIGKPGWVKVCPKQTKDESICLVQTDDLNRATGEPYSPIRIEIVTKGKEQKRLLMASVQHILPVYVAVTDKKTNKKKNVLAVTTPRIRIPTGVRYQIDKGDPVDIKFSWCDRRGCNAVGEAKNDLIDKLKKGKVLTFAVMTNNQAVPLIVPLEGFDKAFDGPAMKTTDFETRMRSRQVQFRKQAEAQQKKIDESSKPANSSTTVKKK